MLLDFDLAVVLVKYPLMVFVLCLDRVLGDGITLDVVMLSVVC